MGQNLSKAFRNTDGRSVLEAARLWIRPLGRFDIPPAQAAPKAVKSVPSPPPLLDPEDLCLFPPNYYTVSSICEFRECPQSFLFRHLYDLKSQPTSEQLRGSQWHTALHKLRDLPSSERTVTALNDLYREIASEEEEKSRGGSRRSLSTSSLTEASDKDDVRLLELLNSMKLEDAAILSSLSEVSVSALLPVGEGKQTQLVTTPKYDPYGARLMERFSGEPFVLKGRMDRLVHVQVHHTDSTADQSTDDLDQADHSVLWIVDDKSSGPPNRKYEDRKFLPLEIYALILHEAGQADVQRERKSQSHFSRNDNNHDESPPFDGLPVRFLTLAFDRPGSFKPPKPWTRDVGATPRMRAKRLDATRRAVQDVHRQVLDLVCTQDPRRFVGCDWSFCFCHKCRPRFVPGTVWEPPAHGPRKMNDK
jgi:PD-(D/E)XK nuclease superfamily